MKNLDECTDVDLGEARELLHSDQVSTVQEALEQLGVEDVSAVASCVETRMTENLHERVDQFFTTERPIEDRGGMRFGEDK